MRVLLDNNVNRRFAQFIAGHEVVHARQLGWMGLENGDLIAAAEEEGFDAVITCDKQIQYQQNLAGRNIAIIVLNSLFIKLEYIKPLAPLVNEALNNLEPAKTSCSTNRDRSRSMWSSSSSSGTPKAFFRQSLGLRPRSGATLGPWPPPNLPQRG